MVPFLREFDSFVVCRNGGVPEDTSGSENVASVASMLLRYPYHCVCARNDHPWVFCSESLSGWLLV